MGIETKITVPVALVALYSGMADLAGKIRDEFDKPILIEDGDLMEGFRKGNDLVEENPQRMIRITAAFIPVQGS